MAVISIPYNEPWFVGGPAFRAVLDPLIAVLPDGDDRDLVLRAYEYKGLLFDRMPPGQRSRIAAALLGVIPDLRESLIGKLDPDEWDLGLADRLNTLEMLLHDLVEQAPE